jgi:hypothetical protein
MARLSKSKIMSARQCAKRAHLEVHRKDLAKYSAKTQAMFQLGHDVGDLAIQLYDDGSGTLVDYHGGSFGPALAKTRHLMGGMFKAPVFEATLRHEGVLVREDVLLPDGDSWRVIEVKAATKVKPQYLEDCAVQAWVHHGAGHALSGIALAHINNQFVYQGDGNFDGFLIEHDLTEQVMEMLPLVPLWAKHAREAIDGPEPKVAVGQHCTKPYECPFVAHCWPQDARYPIHGLAGSRKKLGEWVACGYEDVRDVPTDLITSENQLRIHRVTCSEQAELLPGAAEFVRELAYPRYYLDFETASVAIPVWEGTRPYEQLPFQYSCHIEDGPGQMRHEEFLDLNAIPPMRVLAEKMIADLGGEGPILMYTDFERRVIMKLAERYPDLADDLVGLVERLVDLKPVVKDNYYHPDMLGSWSIKDVLPCIAPDMNYADLEGIAEGMEASGAYLDAIKPGADPAEATRIDQELRKYCRFDTDAMVRIVHYFEAFATDA